MMHPEDIQQGLKYHHALRGLHALLFTAERAIARAAFSAPSKPDLALANIDRAIRDLKRSRKYIKRLRKHER